jgi:membrane-bound ClpP family serine protease
VTASTHLRGIVIAGVLAAIALGLGFVTLAMNSSASHTSPPAVIVPPVHHHVAALAKRTVSSAKAKTVAAKAKTKPVVKTKAVVRTKVVVKPKPKPKPVVKPDPNYLAAVAAGLPKNLAHALAASSVVVVQLTSKTDPIAQLAAADARAGAKLAHVPYVTVSIDTNGGAVQALTRALGQLPDAPATIVYTRPTSVFVTLTGYNDRTIVQQAVANAQATIVPSTSSSEPATVTGAQGSA